MPIHRRHWLWFGSFAVLSFAIWLQFTYPQFAFINFNISRGQALKIAQDYLHQTQKADLTHYRHATVFISNDAADRYLQKTLGFNKEISFLRKHDFELFFWATRFFKENSQEEFIVTVSAATGQITDYTHKIKDTDYRVLRTEEESRGRAFQFLHQEFAVDPKDFLVHSENSTKFENRTEYSFSWEKKGVFVRWSPKENTGGAKLLVGATIAGDDIVSFQKLQLQIPEQFDRFMSKQMNVGRNLGILFRIIYYTLLTASIFYVMVRRNDLVMHTVKRFALILTASLFLVHVLSYFNDFENLLFVFPTTSTFPEFLWRNIMNFLMDAFIVTIGILMPCLAGESLHYESLRQNREGGFLHYVTSTLFSRRVFQSILLGYLGAFIMIGIQSAAFAVGQQHLGIWIEHIWMAQTSSGYLPFLTAFIIGYSASFVEEISFRIFSISLGKKFLKNTLLAVVLSAVMWGFGHTAYRVFPMWFRGLEVTCLGIFLGLIYLRFGIIPVLVAHFVFDVFWGSSAFLLGHSLPQHFYSSLAVLLLPLLIGFIAYLRNQPAEARAMQWRLTPHQIYNLDILKDHLSRHPQIWEGKDRQVLRDEIVSHGWDIAVVEMALDQISKNRAAF